MSETKTVYSGITQCANATGIPFDVLLLARNHKESPKGLHGFDKSNRIYWNSPGPNGTTLEQWINEHLAELTSVDGEDKEYWTTRKERAKALLSELELEEKQDRIVDKQVVRDLLERIATAQVSLFNGKLRQELPARLNLTPEQIKTVDGMISDVFNVMQRNVDQWNK